MSNNNLMQNKFFAIAMNINLNLIITYFNDHKRLMANQIVDINNQIEECEESNKKRELIFEKKEYSKTFEPMLVANTFLMMYSYLEEFLYLTSKSYGYKISARSSILKRFKLVLEGVFKMKNCQTWNFLFDCEKIRNCILHANGRVDISKDKEHLESLAKNPRYSLKIVAKRLVVKAEFLEEVDKVMRKFISEIESYGKGKKGSSLES